MRGNPANVPSPPKFDTAYPAANTHAEILKAAEAGVTHVIKRVDWSYSGTPTGGRLAIFFDEEDLRYDIDILEAGDGYVDFEEEDLPGLFGAMGVQASINLYAGGAGVTGKLTATLV